jgi:MFS superfamily sulfate permease-like transporter
VTPLPSVAPSARTLPWADIVAGIALAGLLLPEAVAYSSIANLPPQAGVIALFAGLICYGLIGKSRYAIVSATSSSAAVLAAATASTAGTSLSLRLAMAVGLVMLSGLFFLFAGMARVGSVSDFIAKPVLRGFSFGLAIVIILKQIAGIVGVSPRHNDAPRFLAELCADPGAWNWSALAVCLVALLLLLLLGRLPYLRRLPAALVVIAIGIAAVRWGGGWLDLSHRGIALVGAIDLKLDAPSLPQLSYSVWLNAVELALAMLMILYAESYGSIRGFALKHGDTTTPNRDLLALGAANLLSGLFHGMPVGAGY